MILLLALSIVLLSVISRILSEDSVFSTLHLGVTMFAALICLVVISYIGGKDVWASALGIHFLSIPIAVIMVAVVIRGGFSENMSCLILGLCILPVALVYLGMIPFRWTSIISIVVAACILLFGHEQDTDVRDHDIDPAKTVLTAVLIIITTVTLWYGSIGLAQWINNTQYSILASSVISLLIMELLLILKAKRILGMQKSMRLSKELAMMDLALGFFTAVIMWN